MLSHSVMLPEALILPITFRQIYCMTHHESCRYLPHLMSESNLILILNHDLNLRPAGKNLDECIALPFCGGRNIINAARRVLFWHCFESPTCARRHTTGSLSPASAALHVFLIRSSRLAWIFCEMLKHSKLSLKNLLFYVIVNSL